MSPTVAFLIIAHTDHEHFGRLVRTLSPWAHCYVHIDLKADITLFRRAAEESDVHFIEERVSVSWAGISMVDAQIALLRAACQSAHAYTRLLFLSGADYPLQPQSVIEHALTVDPQREFIKFFDMRESPDHYLRHVRRQWFREPFLRRGPRALRWCDRAVRKLMTSAHLPNAWPSHLVPCFGSQWIGPSLACARHLLAFHDANPWYRRCNAGSFSPDEHYFHTIVGNSPFVDAAGGIRPFPGSGTWRMANLHLIHPTLEKYYTIADWDDIRDSDRLFIRKLRSRDGTELIRRIDERHQAVGAV